MKSNGRLMAPILAVALAGCGSGGAAIPTGATTTKPPTSTADRPDQPRPAAAGTLAYILNGDVFVADPDGSNVVKIADGRPGNDCHGSRGESYSAEGSMWSPNGRYLAYRSMDCSHPLGYGGGVISDAEGNVVATFPREGWQIAWSPDSTRVAVWESTFETIGVYGLDGARQAELTMPPGWSPTGDHDPEWMPDGTSVWLDGWELPLDGSPPQLLPWLGEDPYATYSPDGSLVAYSYYTNGSLMVARADGSEPREVFDRLVFGFDWGHPWSATGDRIAFATQVRGSRSMSIGVTDVATGAATLLTEGESGARLQAIGFSPRGDRILFSSTRVRNNRVVDSSLWSVGVDGSNLRLVVARTWEGEWLSRSPETAIG
jgi:Tol biopolymer transport system component